MDGDTVPSILASSEQGCGASPAGPDDAIKTSEPPEEPQAVAWPVEPAGFLRYREWVAAQWRDVEPGKATAREGGGEQRWYHGAESAVL